MRGVTSTGVTSNPSGSLRSLRGRTQSRATSSACSSRATRRRPEEERQGRSQELELERERERGTPTAHGCEHGDWDEELRAGVSQSGTTTSRPARAARAPAWQLGLGHVDESLDEAAPSSGAERPHSLGAGLGAGLLRWLHGRGLW